jgi:Subtilisin-like serine proteases
MQSAQPNEQIRIIVTLAEQFDLGTLESRTRFLSKEQSTSLAIEELTQFSDFTQQGLVNLLSQYPESVSEINPHWLFNGVDCKATKEVIEAIAKRNDVASIDLEIETKSTPLSLKEAEIDRSYSIPWTLEQIHADQVWDSLGYTGKNVIVAIIDSGVNYNHPGLADNLWDGGTQYPNHGYNFYRGTKDPDDAYGHGTMIAGLVAGKAAFRTGVAPDAKNHGLACHQRLRRIRNTGIHHLSC